MRRRAGVPPRFAGWPRRKLPATFELDGDTVPREERLPNLWIGGQSQNEGDWLMFQAGREARAIHERLCVVCGERMEGTIVLGLRAETTGVTYTRRRTDGPGGHPRCFMVAVNTCPHFRRGEFADKNDDTMVGWTYDGPSSGHDFVGPFAPGDTAEAPVDPAAVPITLGELRALAKSKPLGI